MWKNSPGSGCGAQVAPGEEFECSGPEGTFRLAEPLRDTIFLAAGTGLGLIVGTNRLRKQGLSPADVQAMIDQHNRAVLKDLD